MNPIAQLRATRRYITSFLLNIDIKPAEMQVSTLLTLLDHFCDNPEEFKELKKSNDKRL